jgi:hypothetical protein
MVKRETKGTKREKEETRRDQSRKLDQLKSIPSKNRGTRRPKRSRRTEFPGKEVKEMTNHP